MMIIIMNLWGIKQSNHPVRQANAAGIGVVVLSTWPYERP